MSRYPLFCGRVSEFDGWFRVLGFRVLGFEAWGLVLGFEAWGLGMFSLLGFSVIAAVRCISSSKGGSRRVPPQFREGFMLVVEECLAVAWNGNVRNF